MTLDEERAAAQALLAALEQLRDVERALDERRAALLRALDDAASIAGGAEVQELFGRAVAERSLGG